MCAFFLCHSPNDNAYAHPLDLLPLVDLNLRKVIRIDQHSSPPKVRHIAPAADNKLAQTTKAVTHWHLATAADNKLALSLSSQAWESAKQGWRLVAPAADDQQPPALHKTAGT